MKTPNAIISSLTVKFPPATICLIKTTSHTILTNNSLAMVSRIASETQHSTEWRGIFHYERFQRVPQQRLGMCNPIIEDKTFGSSSLASTIQLYVTIINFLPRCQSYKYLSSFQNTWSFIQACLSVLHYECGVYNSHRNKTILRLLACVLGTKSRLWTCKARTTNFYCADME